MPPPPAAGGNLAHAPIVDALHQLLATDSWLRNSIGTRDTGMLHRSLILRCMGGGGEEPHGQVGIVRRGQEIVTLCARKWLHEQL